MTIIQIKYSLYTNLLRTSIHPKLPNSMHEIKTNKQENFLLVNDKPNVIVRFSTKSNLEYKIFKLICKLCPKLFMQLFTIYELHNDNNYVPLIFIFTTKQSH
ncbi:MULE domain-containing protein [Aphis craccivora]|uniref:MULE domain-containing protein n=1 Tax=Aphis craccivora TaxID=307492 RepID=A0A6G0YU77_APHCR|nr:MULE domain-containing protein [Aphis craccivora]